MARSLNRAALLASLLLLVSPLFAQTRNYSEGGYADRHSVVAGQPIEFHIASSSGMFDVELINLASPFTVIQTINGVTSQARDCTGMWENGCNWPVTTVFTVPVTWTPGYYVARFPTSEGDRHILFAVRAAVPGSYSPIAVIQTTNSDVAYNRFGGKSVYDTASDDGQRAHIVSFNRPYYDDAGFARFQIWERRFVEWMKAEGRTFEVITDDDMEAGLPLDNYKAVLVVGHSEYWSLNARQHLEAYSRNGGHVAIFGGNTMWWQVRVDLQTRQMTVYKDATLDPMTGVNDDLVTTNFSEWPVLNPENSILGASFLNAAYVNRLENYERVPVEDRTPYTVRNANHWVFAGTGLANGDEMGRIAGAIEVDGALFNTLPNGDVETEGSDGTPLSYQVLATLPASSGYATIGFYANEQGGGVFNGAARDWTYGLTGGDAAIQQITRNVLDRFATGEPFEYEPRVTPNLAEDRFNSGLTSPPLYLPGWRYHRFGFDIVPQCAQEGPTGLMLAGPRWTQVVRNLAVGRAGISKAAASIWVNTDELETTAAFATTLVGLVDYKGETGLDTVAALEIFTRPEGHSVRVSTFDGTTKIVSTNWVVLQPGWQLVQFSWESPGQLTLNVGGTTKVSAFNPRENQSINAVMIEFAGSRATGTMCVDHVQFRGEFAPASAATSTIVASPAAIVADGSSTAEVTVTLFDENGDQIVIGGDEVTLSTTLGALSPVSDDGEGTYTATLTSGTISGTATIGGTVNGEPLDATATVTFTPVPATFTLSSAASAVAGQPVTLDLAVDDSAQQPATAYRGTVHFSGDAASGTLPSDYTFTEADGGRHQFSATAPMSVGTWTIAVTDTATAGLSDSLTIDVQGETSTTLSASPAESYRGQPVTFTATIASSAAGTITGTVTFRDGASTLGTASVVDGEASFSTSSLADGTHSVTAEYAGAGGFLGSTSAPLSYIVRAPEFSAPVGVTAETRGTTVVRVSWLRVEGASRYEVFRRGPDGGFQLAGVTTWTAMGDDFLTPDTAYVYFVRAIDSAGNASENSAEDVVVTMEFADPSIRAATRVKAVHLTQLRTAVNAMRATAGLAAFSFTDGELAGRPPRAVHFLELRDALSEARTALGFSAVTFSSPAPQTGGAVRASHLEELRNGVR